MIRCALIIFHTYCCDLNVSPKFHVLETQFLHLYVYIERSGTFWEIIRIREIDVHGVPMMVLVAL
jgi:hypothetical protein